jgi:prepilin-type N-terminal cleavage/methylation domain-containing protein
VRPPATRSPAFTLIELLAVVAIIAILVGLLFPAFKAVQNQARQTQAKNDLTQIVNAVNAFYTDYGKYPLVTADVTYGSTTIPNNDLFYTLRAVSVGANLNNVVNTRQIVYISPPFVKNDTVGSRRSGVSPTDGNYYDAWGTQYQARIDGNYDNSLTNPYNQGAGPSPLTIGVISWSLGTDQALGSIPPSTGNGIFTNSDDVISWQ